MNMRRVKKLIGSILMVALSVNCFVPAAFASYDAGKNLYPASVLNEEENIPYFIINDKYKQSVEKVQLLLGFFI